MDAPRFPLMQLPVSCTQLILRILIPHQAIGISLLSNKCKNLVQSVGIKAKPITCIITSLIILLVHFGRRSCVIFHFDIEDKENGKYVLKKPSGSVDISFDGDLGPPRFILSENQMNLKKWLEHLQFLFGCSKTIDIGFRWASSRFDIYSLRETFPDISRLEISETECPAFKNLIFQEFLPVKTLEISPSCFQNARISPDILIQNMKTFCILELTLQHSTPMKLDDLLMMNGRIIKTINLVKTLKEFNMFLKLWMNGSNPNLEYISFRFSNWDEEDANIVMKGIKHQLMPKTLAREHRSVYGIVRGGMDIHRYDGVKATVLAGRSRDGKAAVILLVWHDHCIVP